MSRIPSAYQALYDTIVECNREFDVVIRRAEATFMTESARRTLDDWINLVKETALEMRNAYSKSRAGMTSSYGIGMGH